MFDTSVHTTLFNILNAKSDKKDPWKLLRSIDDDTLGAIKSKYPIYFNAPPSRPILTISSLDALLTLSICVDVWWAVTTFQIPAITLLPLSIAMGVFTAILVPLVFIKSYLSQKKDEEYSKKSLELLAVKEAAADTLLERFFIDKNVQHSSLVRVYELGQPSIKKLLFEGLGIFGMVYLSCFSGVEDIMRSLGELDAYTAMSQFLPTLIAVLVGLSFAVYRTYNYYNSQKIKYESKKFENEAIQIISEKKGRCSGLGITPSNDSNPMEAETKPVQKNALWTFFSSCISGSGTNGSGWSTFGNASGQANVHVNGAARSI